MGNGIIGKKGNRIPVYRSMLCWLLLGITLVAPRLARTEHPPTPFAPNAVTTSTLPNGLRLVVREDHTLPIVSLEVLIRTGSAAESGVSGVAHYLEHVVFQGSAKYPDPMSAQYALESVGGISNAVTSRDATRFHVTGPSDQVERMVQILADVTLAPLLRDESCEHERKTILAEIARTAEHPQAQLFDQAYALTYRTHPYHDSALGTVDQVTAITPTALRTFYARWYVPNNMTVVLVGDITPDAAMTLVTSAFGSVKSVPPPHVVNVEAALTQPVQSHMSGVLPDTYQVIALPMPSSQQFSAMVTAELLAAMLVDGPEALLPTQWTAEQITFGKFGIESIGMRNTGRLLIWAQTPPQMAGKLYRSTMGLLQRIATQPLPSTVLESAKQRLAAKYCLDNEQYSDQADTLAFFETLGDATYANRYLATLDAITLDQLRLVIPNAPLAWITLGQPPKGL